MLHNKGIKGKWACVYTTNIGRYLMLVFEKAMSVLKEDEDGYKHKRT